MVEAARIERQLTVDPETTAALLERISRTDSPFAKAILDLRIREVETNLSPTSPYRYSLQGKAGDIFVRKPYRPKRPGPRHASPTCPNAHFIVLEGVEDSRQVKSVLVHCRSRGCDVCGQLWVAERVANVDQLVRDHDGWFEVVYLANRREVERHKKALARYRKAGGKASGIHAPTTLEGGTTVLIAREHGDTKPICRTLPGTKVDKPRWQARKMIELTAAYANEAAAIDAKHRPKVGSLQGFGEWKGMLAESDPEVDEARWKLVPDMNPPMSAQDMADLAKPLDGHPVVWRRGMVDFRFASPVGKARWFYAMGYVSARDDEPEWAPSGYEAEYAAA